MQYADTPLLAGAAHLRQAAVTGGARQWNWGEIHTASMELAARLAPADTVCNLCGSRAGFLITWLAALRRGCLQVLPPSGGPADLVAILRASAQACIVVDDAQLLQPQWSAHARFLVLDPMTLAASVDATALAWTPDWDAQTVRLYTSGSTGAPLAQARTLGQLAMGASALGARLKEDLADGLAALRTIICSVPPQHMFGLETSVMLPLLTGIAVLDRRPLLPADVRAAFDGDALPAAWIATPLHLRALAQAGEALPHCRATIVSTMPLAPALAAQVEDLTAAPVLEIYGSTETGVVAMRRTARQDRWRPVEGVRLAATQGGTTVWGGHFPSPQVLADQTESDAQGDFQLLGRQGDLLKIAGRRASLAGLNLLLQDLPGLDDGVLYQPAGGSPNERLVLIHAGAPLDRAAAHQWLRQRMDPVFLPRTIIRVDCLPRTASGKLPRSALDRIYADRQPRDGHGPR